MDVSMHYTDSGVLIIGRAGTLPTPPSLIANVILRLVLCPIAILLTFVPVRILWRNGEFPACTYVANLWVLIFFVFVNATIWRNQDFDSWWLGYGWCDLQAYIQYAFVTLYSTSVCAIMQRLSSQVGLTRVTGLSTREKRRRLLVQSLIIFPVPVLQIIITVFVQGQRYALAPASGCTNAYTPTAVFLVFFILPPLLFTIAACFHTCVFAFVPCFHLSCPISYYHATANTDVQSKHTASSARSTPAPKRPSAAPTRWPLPGASELAESCTLWSCASWYPTHP